MADHPYRGMYLANLQPALTEMGQAGQITQVEFQQALAQLQSPSCAAAVDGFLAQLETTIPNMNELMMRQCIKQFAAPLIQQIRIQLQQQQSMFRPGIPQPTVSMPQMAYGQMFPGTGMVRPGFGGMFVQQNQFGGVPQLPTGQSYFGRPQPAGFQAPAAGVMSPGFTAPNQRVAMPGQTQNPVVTPNGQPVPKEYEQQFTPQVQKKAPPAKWAPPEVMENKKLKPTSKTEVDATKFKMCNGEIVSRIIASDPRIRYTSDEEAIAAYKNALNIFPDTQKKFLTVAYKQIKVLKAECSEFTKMVTVLSGELAKNSQSAETKLRAIIEIIKKYPFECMDAFTKFFLEELDAHVGAGALTDHKNPKFILSLSSLDAVLKILTGTCSKETLNSLNAIPGFMNRFDELINSIIDHCVTNLHQVILKPDVDPTVIDDFSRVIPAVWSADGGANWRGTEDLFNVFLTTREVISGSKTESAMGAESDLKNKINEICRKFTVIYVNRIASWCDYGKSHVVGYDDHGNCIPSVIDPANPGFDMGFLVSESFSAMYRSKDSRNKCAAKSLYCTCDEETYHLNYDITTDGWVWVGRSQFWR